jgi:peroxiredoxin
VRRRLQKRALAGVLAVSLSVACGSDPGAAGAPETKAASAASPKAEPVSAKAGDGHDHRRKDRPLPAFGGRTLAGDRLEISSLLGRRLLLFFFNPDVEEAQVVARAVQRVSAERDKHNFEILGVAMAASPERARAFTQEHGVDYPVLDDSGARIARRLGLRTPVAMLGADAEGYVNFGFAQFATDAPNAEDLIEGQLRTSLRLPEPGVEDAPGSRPVAPLFEGRILDSEDTFRLADHGGKAVVLVFFLHTCPHCHEFLEYVKPLLEDAPEDARPLLVGVEVTGKTFAVRESLRSQDLDFFPVIFDDDGSIRADYGVFAGVPDIVLIDAQGRIAHRAQGWQPDSDGPLLRMRMAKLSGAPVPMLLRPSGFSGSEACGVCHEGQHVTWQLTQHAQAFDTLVKHASDGDPECVSCHVVGFGKPGGFDLADRPKELEDVGCESCHGRGGPHLSPQFIQAGDYSPACLQCHDTKHSLGFEYGTFVQRISHAANAEILALPAAERREILAARGAVRKDVLPTQAEHVGSEACRTCHEAEFATWAGNPHAAALASLASQGKQADPDCLRCHATAFGKPGGFPASADVADHDDLARVGCESCHGPGGDHITEGATKLGSIVSLGDKCDSCVILQICGGCHDDANDPGFEFEVLDKIEKIRHGTIEAGTGKPLGESGSSARAGPVESDGVGAAALLHEAFAWADRGRGTEPWNGR